MRAAIVPVIRTALVLGLVLCLWGLSHGETKPAGQPPGPPIAPPPPNKLLKQSVLEARAGYQWGTSQVSFRDGDNALHPPGRKDVSIESPVFGAQGETFFANDLSVRVQGWMNLPQQQRTDFYIGGTALAWDTPTRCIVADASVVYHLGPLGILDGPAFAGPYAAKTPAGYPFTFVGVVAGYRFQDFISDSVRRAAASSGTFEDHTRVQIPYLGLYYADGNMRGSVIRLDVLASALTLATVDARQTLSGTSTKINGDSVTGFWFESLLVWSWPVTNGAYLGAFANYNYTELSGGARMVTSGNTTRFSMDFRTHVFRAGFAATVSF